MEKNLWQKATEELLLQAFRTIETTLNQMQADAEAEAELAAEQAQLETQTGEEGDEKTPEQLAAEKQAALMKKKRMKALPPLTGRIDSDKLQELLSMHGEPLNPTEIEDLMKVSFSFTVVLLLCFQNVPLEDGQVDYVTLAQQLANE